MGVVQRQRLQFRLSRVVQARGADGKVYYNYEMGDLESDEMPGVSVFIKDASGAIFHSYSAYARGLDILVGAYNFLDLVPKGRDEAELPWSMAWVRRHDEYDDTQTSASSCRSEHTSAAESRSEEPMQIVTQKTLRACGSTPRPRRPRSFTPRFSRTRRSPP